MTRAWASARGACAGCALAGLLVCPISVPAQSTPIAHGTVHLVAQESRLEAGREAWIGVLFDLDRGWHIYWVNPGDAGEPPTINWALPPGFRAGTVRWPRPLRLTTGPLVDYGYEGRTLLPVPMQVPSDYQAGARVTLSADVRYFACREVCIPARAHVTMTLPSGAAAEAAATRALFRKALAAVPKPTPATWKLHATLTDEQIVLAVQTGSAETEAMFFPIDRDQIDNAAPPVVAPMEGGGVRMTLRRSALADKPPSVVNGVVVLGGNRAFEIAVPVSARR